MILLIQAGSHLCCLHGQVVEGLGIKEGDLLEFELTLERNLRVTVMKSSTVTRKPKKMAPSELQATINKKKTYRNLPMDQLSRSMMLTGQEGILPDLLLPAAAAAAAAAQGLPIRLPDVSAAQVTRLFIAQYAVGNAFDAVSLLLFGHPCLMHFRHISRRVRTHKHR